MLGRSHTWIVFKCCMYYQNRVFYLSVITVVTALTLYYKCNVNM